MCTHIVVVVVVVVAAAAAVGFVINQFLILFWNEWLSYDQRRGNPSVLLSLTTTKWTSVKIFSNAPPF
jgi:hypothetical protein